MFITGEHAERLGRTALKRLAYQLGDNVLRDRFTTGDVALRTYGLMAHEFRATFERRLPENVARLFRYTTWPKGVWVVEALDRERWDNGSTDRRDCVLGEVVIDATALVRPSFEDIRRPPSDDRVEDAAGDRVDDVVAQHDGPLDDIWRSVVGIHVTGHAYVFPPGELVQETGPPVTAFEPYATGCPVAPW